LHKEVDNFANKHGDHICGEVRNTALLGTVADDVPFELNTKECQVDSGEAEISIAHKGKGGGEKGQNQILENGYQVADDDEKSAFTNPYGKLGMLLGKVGPKLFDLLHSIAPPKGFI
jgi:hypothetical protein